QPLFNQSFQAQGLGSKLNLSNLTTIIGDPGGNQAPLTVQAFDGGAIDFSGFTQLGSSTRLNFLADGTASNVNLINLTTIIGHPGGNQAPLAVQALSGGAIDFSGLPQLGSSTRINFLADGTSSTIDLSNLSTIIGHAVYGTYLEVENNGRIISPKLDTAQF